MKFEIKKDTMLEVLSNIEYALPQKTVIESLKGIKIIVNENELIFITSKQELAIQETIVSDFVTMEEGEVIIPAQFIIPVIRKSNANHFIISKDLNTVTIESKNSKTELMTYDISSYPQINFNDMKGTEINIKGLTFKNIYTATKNAVAINTMKPLLMGINLKLEGGNITASSTDSRRLSIVNYKTKQINNIEFTLNKSTYQVLNQIVKTNDDLKLFINNQQITIFVGNKIIKCRAIEGNYPLVDKLIPTTSHFSYQFNKSDILPILDKIVTLSSRDGGNLILNIDKDKLNLKSSFKEFGNIEETCPIANVIGKSFDISFDPKFMIDALHSLDQDLIQIKFTDNISPFILTNIDNVSNIQIISPLRIS